MDNSVNVNPGFDVFMPVAAKDAAGIKKPAELLAKNSGCRKIIIAAPAASKSVIESIMPDKAEFLDEEAIYPGLNKAAVKNFLEGINISNASPGWYLQQFLKMAFCRVAKTKCYLIWDSDTYLLRSTEFISGKGKLLIDNSRIWKRDAFDETNIKLTGLKRPGNFTYIAEHMMVQAGIISDLISSIENAPGFTEKSFWERILSVIDAKDFADGGFSEFELMGWWMHEHMRGDIIYRPLSSQRNIARELGSKLNQADIKVLSRKYDFVTLEKQHENKAGPLKVMVNKLKNLVLSFIGGA